MNLVKGLLFFKFKICLATCLPICIATGATIGKGLPSNLKCAPSPITKIFGLDLKYSSTIIRLDLSASPIFAHSEWAATPAAHIIVPAINISPFFKCTVDSYIRSTSELVLTVTPISSNSFWACIEDFSLNIGNTREPASTKVTEACL